MNDKVIVLSLADQPLPIFDVKDVEKELKLVHRHVLHGFFPDKPEPDPGQQLVRLLQSLSRQDRKQLFVVGVLRRDKPQADDENGLALVVLERRARI